MINVLCYGDSNTWGFDAKKNERFPFEKRWCGVLQRCLGDGYKIYEEGLGGRTTAFDDPVCDDANGAKGILQALKTTYPLDLVIIMLGTNDCKIHLRQESYSIAAGMEKLVKTVISPHFNEAFGGCPRVMIICPARFGIDKARYPSTDFDEDSARHMNELPELYRQIAQKFGCMYFDAKDASPDVLYDGVHMDEKSHERLGKMLAESIKRTFE